MFHNSVPQVIEFDSNPPLSDGIQIVYSQEDNKLRPHLETVPRSNVSVLDGQHYNADTMSLRAKVNLGIPMSKVYLSGLENDPTKLLNSARSLESQISKNLERIKKQSQSSPAAKQE